MPERFDLTYIDKNGEKKRPVMLHRVIFGSVERFIGILIEHFAGAFPMWLSPVQINVIPVNNEYHLDYARELFKNLQNDGLRVEIDEREEKLGYKMRESVMKKIPYTLVIGQKEVDNKTLSYRKHGSEETITVSYEEFIPMINKEIEEKKLLNK